jgi:hypothetical protein
MRSNIRVGLGPARPNKGTTWFKAGLGHCFCTSGWHGTTQKFVGLSWPEPVWHEARWAWAGLARPGPIPSTTQDDENEDQEERPQEEDNDQGGDANDQDKEDDEGPKPPHLRVHQAIQRDHPVNSILGDIHKGVTTRSRVAYFYEHYSFVSSIEPYRVEDALRDFLITNGFKVRTANPTLFTKTIANDLFVCQIYVDDIIFGSTNKSTCEEFSRIMIQKFEMSMMGELKYFLGF